MKSSRKSAPLNLARMFALAATAATLAIGIACAADSLPAWQQFAEAGAKIESALFRAVPMPGGAVMSRRPPREAQPLLDALVRNDPNNSELYSLRALEEEQQLDFAAAESDWKSYALRAADRAAAQFTLADFYHRRGRPADELAALSGIAQAPGPAADDAKPIEQQQSWLAFERILTVIDASALGADLTATQYRNWLARYPAAPQLYSRYFDFLLAQKKYDDAVALIAEYVHNFPEDAAFPVVSRAKLEVQRGKIEQGLAIYDRAFQPLWPEELIQNYFDLLRQTQNLRKFAAQVRAAIAANPNDLNSTARLFFYYRQSNNPVAAADAIAAFCTHKESSDTPWSAADLYTLAKLTGDAQLLPESARYYFALYNSGRAVGASLDANTSRSTDARAIALAGLGDLLIAHPAAPIRFGAGDLSFYKDVATADTGPGFLNGILSLLLNSESPRQEYSDADQKAAAYFHLGRAAELVERLGHDFPSAPELPPLRARLLQIYKQYGDTEAVIREGRRFLADFPNASERIAVYLQIADAYVRTNQIDQELALYDALLRELAARRDQQSSAEESSSQRSAASAAPADYSRILDRYLSRLAAQSKLPRALEVLRIELQRNPNDPAIYERLAQFLDQNRMQAQVEEVYRRAIAQFPDRSWYQQLARFYLRYRRNQDYARLTEQVIQIFSGTDLENYFREAGGGSAALYLQMNLYANRRFPHDLMFVRNLLGAYSTPPTRDLAAWEALLRQHWFEADDLRNRYFEFLSRTHQLDAELAAVSGIEPAIAANRWDAVAQSNPVAVMFYAEAQLWKSHFETAAPALQAAAVQFPADTNLGERASSVYRSLAYYEPRDTEIAVRIEANLLAASPTNREILERIGDIYSDRNLFAKAAPYWNRMAEIESGKPEAFLAPASVFWDYYDFANALRLLDAGRTKLNYDALFGYERGAILETERDYPRAIAEYVHASLAGANSQATDRLLALARRQKLREAIDEATKPPADAPNASPEAIRLRIGVLEEEKRLAEIPQLLDAAAARATTYEGLSQLESIACECSLELVHEQILEQEAELTSDPVNSLQIRLRLANSYEQRKDLADAQRVIDELYSQNPTRLGIVRGTVDFYWRNKMQPRAIAILLEAAQQSNSVLRQQFTFEAARKSVESRDYAQAHRLLNRLLQDSPFNAEYVAASADAFSKEKDSAGLRDFYLAQIHALQQSALQNTERAERIAQLRRGLIPALAHLNDFSGATDQYIELINHYPEDATLAAEAANFSADHSQREKLVAFYRKTVADSPRDSRWAVVLARIDTSLEYYAGALDAYAKAIAIRPDRADLRIARAELFERLGKNDEAAADYQKLYELTYHDSQWMLKLAEIRARQAEVNEAVSALKIALIDGRPSSPSNYFDAARRLDAWNMLEPARAMAEQGISIAASDLLATNQYQSGVATYARIMTRLRKQDEAIAELQKARDAVTATVNSALLREAASQGIARVTDSQWRARETELRRDAATNGISLAMKAIGETAATYFTPEEKSRFAKSLEQDAAGASRSDLENVWVGAARAAGFADLEVKWLYQLAITGAPNREPEIRRLIELQNQRLQFAELGQQLEAIAARVQRTLQWSALDAAADAYHNAGETAGELRVLAQLDSQRMNSGEHEARYFELLLTADPNRLVAMATQSWDSRRDSVANFALQSAPPDFTYKVLRARATGESQVWPKAYLGLAGLYLGGTEQQTDEAFRGALDPRPIGELVALGAAPAKTKDRQNVLAGDQWFYYGSRYGEFLVASRRDNFDDLLPAQLEAAAGNTEAYVTSAQDYLAIGKPEEAIADYEHALELDLQRPLLHDAIALIAWNQGDRSRAQSEWRAAISILAKQLDAGRVPPSLWSDFTTITKHLHERQLKPELVAAISEVLTPYLQKNGTYRDTELLTAAFDALNDPPAFTKLLLDLTHDSTAPADFLADALQSSPWIPVSERPKIFARLVEIQTQVAAGETGDDRLRAENQLQEWRLEWVDWLIATKHFAEAAQQFAAVEPVRSACDECGETDEYVDSYSARRIKIAAGMNTLGTLFDEYRNGVQPAPSTRELLQTAQAIEKLGLHDASLQLKEFVYSREVESHNLTAPNFLGLAEIRLQQHRIKDAIALLERMTLVAGAPNDNLDSAASLLEKMNRPTEAADFLQRLAAAEPWNAEARLRLAKDEIAGKQNSNLGFSELHNIGSEISTPYEVREGAATALAATPPSGDLGSAELNLLSSALQISTETTNAPFFTKERERVARDSADPSQRMALLSAELRDTPSADSARLALFSAATEAKKNRFAVAEIEPVIHSALPQYLAGDTSDANDDDSSTEGDAVASSDDINAAFADDAGLNDPDNSDSESQRVQHQSFVMSRTEQIRLAKSLGDAYESLGDFGRAKATFDLARRLETNAERKKFLSDAILRVDARIELRTENERRKPVIHSSLDQDHAVRPKLSALPKNSVAVPQAERSRQ